MQVFIRQHPVRKITIALLAAALLLIVPVAAFAQGPNGGDQIIMGRSLTVTSGQVINGDLAVLGGELTVEQDATVNGDVAVMGGLATLDGVINGDVAAVGGSIVLGPHALVRGDVAAMGGNIQRAPGAVVQGNIAEANQPLPEHFLGNLFSNGALAPRAERTQQPPWQNHSRGPMDWLVASFLQGMAAIAWAALLAAMGVVVILLAPAPTERVANAIQYNALLAFGAGLGTVLISTIILIPLLIITICLIPLAIAVPFVLVAALFFGWIALGWLLGRELLRAANSENATPVWEVIVGVALLTLLWRLPHIVPFIGGLAAFLVMFVAGNIAIGGVVLTRFGSRPYPMAPTPVTPATSQPQLPAESTTSEAQPPIIPPPPPDEEDEA